MKILWTYIILLEFGLKFRYVLISYLNFQIIFELYFFIDPKKGNLNIGNSHNIINLE